MIKPQMVKIIREDVMEEGKIIYYKCEIDGETLWVRYKNGIEQIRNSCDHFE
jgi:hypothetical protein